jgi:hypothetical protein
MLIKLFLTMLIRLRNLTLFLLPKELEMSKLEKPELVELITWVADLECNGCKMVEFAPVKVDELEKTEKEIA